jgi:hypothetical protein
VKKDNCPICQKPYAKFEEPRNFLPFCSERCKYVDLGKWLGGDYSVSRPFNEAEVWRLREPENDNR